MSNIRVVTASLFTVPLPEVLTDARHGDHTHFQLVTVTVTLEDGSEGTGYTYTGGYRHFRNKHNLTGKIFPTLRVSTSHRKRYY